MKTISTSLCAIWLSQSHGLPVHEKAGKFLGNVSTSELKLFHERFPTLLVAFLIIRMEIVVIPGFTRSLLKPNSFWEMLQHLGLRFFCNVPIVFLSSPLKNYVFSCKMCAVIPRCVRSKKTVTFFSVTYSNVETWDLFLAHLTISLLHFSALCNSNVIWLQ